MVAVRIPVVDGESHGAVQGIGGIRGVFIGDCLQRRLIVGNRRRTGQGHRAGGAVEAARNCQLVGEVQDVLAVLIVGGYLHSRAVEVRVVGVADCDGRRGGYRRITLGVVHVGRFEVRKGGRVV